MATVSQTIPNYYGGLSEQPDELKIPGQVNKLINTLPDITQGLMKRPGGRLLAELISTTSASKWFHYYRDENEQYIGQLKLSDGTLKMWALTKVVDAGGSTIHNAGDSVTVVYDSTDETAIKNYLKQTSNADAGNIQTLTLNDSTFITNRTITTAMKTAEADLAPDRPPEAYLELKKVAYSSQYAVDLFDSTDKTSVTTATRIEVDRVIDSSNSCYTTSNGEGGTHNPWPAAGNLPGSLGSTRCNTQGTDPTNDDDTMPNVATKIFAVNHMTSDYAASSPEGLDANETAWKHDVTPASGNASDRKNLFFRITTTGQPVAQGNASPPSYYSRYTTTHDLLYGGEGWQVGDTFEVWMKNAKYKITIKQVSTSKIQCNLGNIRPEPTSFDSKTVVTAESILGAIQEGIDATDIGKLTLPTSSIDAVSGTFTTTEPHGFSNGDEVKYYSNGGTNLKYGSTTVADGTSLYIKSSTTSTFKLGTTSGTGGSTIVFSGSGSTGNDAQYIKAQTSRVQLIGNGLYISNPSTFNISTPVSDLLNAFTKSVKDIEDLPSQCKNGYIVRVANSVADEDDYYVKFEGSNGRDGEGVWEECPEPGRKIAFDPATMPVTLIRTADGNFRLSLLDGGSYDITISGVTTTYTVSSWDNCLVGDDVTVPEPSFIGKGINKMLFFRNRMVMLSDENVIMSRPGAFFNFWPKTAVTYTSTDNIDISCSSEFPAIIYDGIQVNTGLLLFTKNQQFMLTTDSDVLSPNTAKINALCTYNFNYKTNPISMGTTVAFLDNGGKFARFFEISAVQREGQPEVLEQSKAVSRSFPKDIDIIANSRENSIIFFAKTGDSKVYGYRYFSGIEKRVQQAWFQWELSGAIQHMAMLDDALYVVIRNQSDDVLQKFSIKIDDESYTWVDDRGTLTDDSDDLTHRIHLDNATVKTSNLLSTTNVSGYTTCILPAGFNKSHLEGDYSRSGTTMTVTTDASNHEFKVGETVQLDFEAGDGTSGEYTILTVPDDNKFTVTHPATGDTSGPVVTNALIAAMVVPQAGQTDTTMQGLYAKGTTYKDGSVYFKIPGNFKTGPGGEVYSNNLVFGYLYDMEVGFPTIYKQDRVGETSYKADVHSSLILHRIKLSLGPSSVFDIIAKKTNKDTYTESFTGLDPDEVVTDRPVILPDQKVTIPLYEKNTNLELSMKSTHASPATLYSLTWEGDYTDAYYKRV